MRRQLFRSLLKRLDADIVQFMRAEIRELRTRIAVWSPVDRS